MFVLPIEMYQYIDSSSGKAKIISSAPQWIKDKAKELDDLSVERYEKHLFESIE